MDEIIINRCFTGLLILNFYMLINITALQTIFATVKTQNNRYELYN